MFTALLKSLWLLIFAIIACCLIYPLALWSIGQFIFPFQANGSLLYGPNMNLIGSKLIAQPFFEDAFFHPRPSAASYDAAASSASNLAASNYGLRNRVAGALGSIVTYQNGKKSEESVSKDIENWFQKDQFQGKPQLVAQWASLHPSLIQAWINENPKHSGYIEQWAKNNPREIEQFVKRNPENTQPEPSDLAQIFFQNYSKENPGKFPSSNLSSFFFDMWRKDNPQILLNNVPADMVMTSASGLDPHITLQNATYQLDRVVNKWASTLERNAAELKKEIEEILIKNSHAPGWGLWGEPIVNVLEINLELYKRYGSPAK